MRPVRRLALIGLICLAVLGVTATLAIMASEGLAWRARVVRAKLLGELPEIPPVDFVKWLVPQSPVYLGGLADNANVFSSIQNSLSDKESVEKGARLFGRLCASCHGDNAKGRGGPDLVSSIGNKTDWVYFSAVKWCRPDTTTTTQPIALSLHYALPAFARNLLAHRRD